MPARRPFTILLLPLLVAAGCALIEPGDEITSSSILKAARSSNDSVRVDIYWADLPVDGAEGLWRSIEETSLSPELRRRLASNGLRAGVVGGALPDELIKLLNPTGESEPQDAEDQRAGVRSLEETGVSKATYTLAPGRRVDLQAGPLEPLATVLLAEEGKLRGQTFNQLQPIYTLELPKPETPSSAAKLVLTPELRHGEQRLRFTPDVTGAISRARTKDIEPFPELAIPATLAAGQTLVVTSTPEADGRLGGYFHRDAAGELKARRAMLIRVAATPREGAFDPER